MHLLLLPQDVVERFHLFCALAFVLAEDMNNSGTWQPSWDLACQCAYFLGAEVVIGACPVSSIQKTLSKALENSHAASAQSSTATCGAVGKSFERGRHQVSWRCFKLSSILRADKAIKTALLRDVSRV